MSSLLIYKWNFSAIWCINIYVLLAIFASIRVICDLTTLDPTSFPSELKSVFSKFSSDFDCNFNHKAFCAFQFVPADWSFHRSMRELAEKLRIAAEAAANALSTFTNVSGNGSEPNLQEVEIHPVTVPQTNYFPCATKTSSIHSSSPTSCILELSVPWPRFAPFVVPSVGTIPGVNLATSVSGGNRVLSNRFTPASPSPAQRYPAPLVCLQVNFRFPPNQSSQVNIDFVSPIQTISTDLLGAPPRSPSATHLSDDLQAVSTLPHDVWVELTVPVRAASGISEPGRETYSPLRSSTALPSIVFGSHGVTWIATVVPTPLRLQITSGVCVDNFRLRSLVPENEIPANSCVRSIRWIEPLTTSDVLILIDEFGAPVRPVDIDAVPVLDGTNTPLLRVYEPHSLMNGMDWLRFTGSLILSVTVTLLFLLFVSVVGLSITMARRHYGRTRRPRRLTLISESQDDHSKDAHDSLLSEVTCPVLSDPEVQSVDPEPSSIQGGESLFHNGTDTFQSRGDTPVENSMIGTHLGSTASVQLLRNWYFYRRKANRTRMQSRAREGNPTSRLPSPLASFAHEMVTRPVQRRNTAASAADNPCRHSFILSADADNQLIIMPAFHSGSAPSTSMREARRGSETHLRMIPESPFYTSQNLSCDRALHWDANHQLNNECAQSLESMDQSPSAPPPPPDYHTSSTVPRSQLSATDGSINSVGLTPPSADFAISDSSLIS